MGLLNKKERVLDVVLTDKGREQMARNNLNFRYYAFSDEGIDYSGSLTAVNSSTRFTDNRASMIQSASDESEGGFSFVAATATFSVPPSDGHTLVASFFVEPIFDSTGSWKITSSGGTTWNFLTSSHFIDFSTGSLEVWYATNVTSSDVSVFLSASDSANMSLGVVEYSGLLSASLSASIHQESSVTTGSLGNAGTTSDLEVIFSAFRPRDSVSSVASQTGHNLLMDLQPANGRHYIFDKIIEGSEEANNIVSWVSARAYNGVTVTFLASGSTPTKANTQIDNLDDYIHQGLAFEAHAQKANRTDGDPIGNFSTNYDLKSFLFTVVPQSEVIPEFITNYEERGEVISLQRRYFIDQLILSTRRRNRLRPPQAIIARATVPKRTFNARLKDYVRGQKIARTRRRLDEGKAVVGRSISRDFIALRGNRALNKSTGEIHPLDDVLEEEEVEETNEDILSIKKEIEVVAGIEQARIELRLKNGEGEVLSKDGYLVEVFESGSDGRLTKLVKETVKNPINDDEIESGFEEFLDLRVDVR